MEGDGPKPPPGIVPKFTALSADCGLDFRREDDIRGQRRIFESTGGGVAMLDFDNDGWLDLLFTGGCQLPRDPQNFEPTCGLYRNREGTRFNRSTLAARLGQTGYCQGVTVGDFDNDGFDDVYITAFGLCGMWHNCGDGTFEDVSDAMAVRLDTWGSSCAFADLNLDGLLDLYVVTYLKESADNPLRCPNDRSPDKFEQCPPSKFEGLADVLFINDGQGGMRNVSSSTSIDQFHGKGLGIVVSDFDRDGRPDIYVGNDGEPNHLFKNEAIEDGGFKLRECAMLSGVALTEAGFAQASMGIAAGDYDNSGTIDLLVTNFSGDSDTFYNNAGQLHFDDVTRRTGVAGPSRAVLGWGTALVDFNNDDRLDLAVVNGHVDDRRWLGQGAQYRMPAQIYMQSDNGKFIETSRWAGEYFLTDWMARGLAYGDVNRDGKLDLAINHQLDVSQCLINATATELPLTRLKLIGTTSNRNALHCKVEVFSPEGKLLAFRELCGGTSFQSCPSFEIALLDRPDVDEKVRVTWPSGRVWERSLSLTSEILVEEWSSGGFEQPKH